jgi:hypothetical protein
VGNTIDPLARSAHLSTRFICPFKTSPLSFPCSHLIYCSTHYPHLSTWTMQVLDPFLLKRFEASAVVGWNFLQHRKVLNDALCPRSLNEFRSMSIPVQSLLSWPTRISRCTLSVLCSATLIWCPMQRSSLYHTSTLLSAHFESATLSLRYILS